MMTSYSDILKKNIISNNESAVIELLNSGLSPNYEGGWPVRLAARYGCHSIVQKLIQYGANPHLLSESGASTLQLAVYSGKHWEDDKWTFLLSCCDSSQLADGAAVAIVFHNLQAYHKIKETGRCNTNLPTTLTGKTVEDLAKGYRLQYLLNTTTTPNNNLLVPTLASNSSPQVLRHNRQAARSYQRQQSTHRNLSPSVASFFNQTANLVTSSPSHRTVITSSPSQNSC